MSWSPEELRKFQKKERDQAQPIMTILVWLFIAWAIYEFFFGK